MQTKITFHEVLQDTQVYDHFDRNENHMVSIIRFTLEAGGKVTPMKVELRQPYGTNFDEPIEVGRPVGQKGPWNHHDFCEVCEQYYREALRKFIRGGGGLRMWNNAIALKTVVELDLPVPPGGGW